MAELPDEVKKFMMQLLEEAEREVHNPLSGLIDPQFTLEERLKTFYNLSLSDEERQTAGIQMAGYLMGNIIRAQSEGKDTGAAMDAYWEQMKEAMKHIGEELNQESPASE